jgi:hypothetical protein
MVPQVASTPAPLTPRVRSASPMKQRQSFGMVPQVASTPAPLAPLVRSGTPLKQRMQSFDPSDSEVIVVTDVVSRVPRTIQVGQAQTPHATLPPPAMTALPAIPMMQAPQIGMGLLQGGSLQAPLGGLSGSLQAPVSARSSLQAPLSGSLRAPQSGAPLSDLSVSVQASVSGYPAMAPIPMMQATLGGSGRYPLGGGSLTVPAGGLSRSGSLSVLLPGHATPRPPGSLTVPAGGQSRSGSLSVPLPGHATPRPPGASTRSFFEWIDGKAASLNGSYAAPPPAGLAGSYAAPPPAGLAGASTLSASRAGSYTAPPAGLAGTPRAGSASVPISLAPPITQPISSCRSLSFNNSSSNSSANNLLRTRSFA